MALLEVKNLGISFGGLRAVISLKLTLKKASFTVSLAQTVPERQLYLIC